MRKLYLTGRAGSKPPTSRHARRLWYKLCRAVGCKLPWWTRKDVAEAERYAGRFAYLFVDPEADARMAAYKVLTTWSERVYGAIQRRQEALALDLIYNYLDDHLRAEHFDAADAVFRVLALERLDTAAMLAVLSITSTARSKLPCRAYFAGRVASLVRARDPEHADALLAGLLDTPPKAQ